MLTVEQIQQFKQDALEAKKIKGFSREMCKMFPELSSGNISDYLAGRIKPSEKFYNGFYRLYKPSRGNVEDDVDIKVIQGTDVYFQARQDKMKAIIDLIHNNKVLSKTNSELVQVHKDLVAMLKASLTGTYAASGLSLEEDIKVRHGFEEAGEGKQGTHSQNKKSNKKGI